MKIAAFIVALSCSLAIAGCPDTPPVSGTPDVSTPDSTLDSGADGAVEVSSDTGSDVGTDVGTDATADTSGPGVDECRSDPDCGANFTQYCAPAGPSWQACGVPCFAEKTCNTDADCAGAGTGPVVCLAVVGSCCGPSDERSTMCAPACDATTCAAGWECSTTTSGCDPVSCDTGYACPYGTTCDTANAPAPPVECGYSSCPDMPAFHGCTRNSCASDADCPGGGHCVLGGCYEDYGVCKSPAA